MQEPPFLLDSALVHAYAALPPGEKPRAVAGGVALEAAAGAVIVEALADGSTFLLFCNEDWETLAAEPHADVEAAKAAAAVTFPRLEWTAFRALSANEREQVETTREFLQDLQRDFPGGM